MLTLSTHLFPFYLGFQSKQHTILILLLNNEYFFIQNISNAYQFSVKRFNSTLNTKAILVLGVCTDRCLSGKRRLNLLSSLDCQHKLQRHPRKEITLVRFTILFMLLSNEYFLNDVLSGNHKTKSALFRLLTQSIEAPKERPPERQIHKKKKRKGRQ